MIHGYHLVLSTYGFWLPNDPRGSMSEKVYGTELSKCGRPTKTLERKQVDAVAYQRWRKVADDALLYPPVQLTGEQAFEVAMAMGRFVKQSRIAFWAFSILEQHLHAVVGRSRFKMEELVPLLKSVATQSLFEKNLHPMTCHTAEDGTVPGMWSEGQWIEYLDSEDAIENAIRYVEENPVCEDKKRQHWSFVQPFEGIPRGAWITYY